MKAIISDRNNQYLVEEGSFVKINKIKINIGEIYIFEKILAIFDKEKILFENSEISKKTVISKIISHFKDKKKNILKFKRRKGYLRHIGHRQNYTMIQILSIKDK